MISVFYASENALIFMPRPVQRK